MVFKSEKQRKAVMAKLNQGSVRSDVRPIIVIQKDNILKQFDIVKSTGLAPSQNIILASRKNRIFAEKLGNKIANKRKLKFFKK
ncbi:hypothetical protein CMI37_37150 [Candidatus Pacearchaeota archaeon]|nr:hypothetical protein [Candidatus Pacearchaeota archaeon]